MVVRRAALIALVGTLLATPVPASADPDPGGPDLGQPVAVADPAIDPAAPPVDDGKVMSTPPATTKSPDGWTLTISAKDETQMPNAPLTTALSSREYTVGGVFNGALDGPGDLPKGVFEVGYQIGCGIDMSTSNGVSLTGTAGISPSIGFLGLDFPNNAAEGLLPGVGGNIGGGITVGLKPGIINVVPVTKKEYKGDRPWVSISNFHVKIDGCVGESFIRSYATLSKSTDEGDAILSWYGVTKKI
ncbi:MspA family porin [Mycolicibacterium vinylchloridicum]|uniref:MspA family porin n=1 Tax=Mycolicibacterium vinylchloridicum TaxID=2736928 RepID=UPI0015CABDED